VGSLWGTDTYTTDSAICPAAIHAGKISVLGGDVAYEIRAGLPSYSGSVRNGETSHGWGGYGCSYVFLGEDCAPPTVSCAKACVALATDHDNCGGCGHACASDESCRKGVCGRGYEADYQTSPSALGLPCSGTLTFLCPSSAGVSLGTVWGTETYTNDSAICVAAVHAGVMKFATGGAVTVEMSPGRKTYLGSVSHGVTSSSWGAWSCSYRFR
jgi:LCCL domain/Stigma-specific protein, Stig1